MKRTILPVALAILAFGISQVRSQEKEPQASWSSQNPGLIRLSLEFTKAIQRGDITTDDAQKLAARILGLPDSTIMFLARRYHKDRDFEALAADVEDQKKAMAPQTAINLKANDPANCRIRGAASTGVVSSIVHLRRIAASLLTDIITSVLKGSVARFLSQSPSRVLKRCES